MKSKASAAERIERVIVKLARLAEARPRSLLALAVVLALALTVLASRIPIGLKLSDFYPPQETAPTWQSSLLKELGGDNRLVVTLESPRPLPSSLQALLVGPLAEALAKLPEVASAEFGLEPALKNYLQNELPRQLKYHLPEAHLQRLAELTHPEQIERRLKSLQRPLLNHHDSLGDYFYRDPLGVQALVASTARTLSGMGPMQIDDGAFADRSKRRRFIVVEAQQELVDFAQSSALVSAVEKTMKDFVMAQQELLQEHQVEVFVVGRAPIVVEGYRTLLEDTRLNLGLSFLAVYLLSAVFFFRPLFSLLANLPILISTALTLLTSYALFGEVHLITLVFCALLIGLGDDFSVHLATHYFMKPPSQERLRLALRAPLAGIFFSAGTAIVAFMALLASSYPVIQKTGITLAIGVVYIFIFSYWFTPPLLQLFSRPTTKSPPLHYDRFLQRLISLPRPMAWGIWAGLVILSLVGISRLQFETHPWSVLTRGNRQADTLAYLNRQLNASFTPLLVVSRAPNAATALQHDQQVYAALRTIQTKSKIAAIQSLSPWLVSDTAQNRANTFLANHPELQPKTFLANYQRALKLSGLNPQSGGYDYLQKEYPERLAQGLESRQQALSIDELRQALGGEKISRYLRQLPDGSDRSSGEWLAVTHLYLQRFPWEKGAMTPFLREWERVRTGLPDNIEIIGEALRTVHHQSTLRRDAVRIAVIIVVAVAGLLLLLFSPWGSSESREAAGAAASERWAKFRQTLKWVMLVIGPVAVGVLILLGTMGWLGIELNFLTLAVLPVILGIGLDEAIHLVARMRQGEMLSKVISEVGPAILVVTSSTIAAFLTLTTTRYVGVHDFGLVGALGVLIMMFVALQLLPLCNRR